MIKPGDIIRYDERERKILVISKRYNEILISCDKGWVLENRRIARYCAEDDYAVIDDLITYKNSKAYWVRLCVAFLPFETEFIYKDKVVEKKYLTLEATNNFEKLIDTLTWVGGSLEQNMWVSEVSGDCKTIYVEAPTWVQSH